MRVIRTAFSWATVVAVLVLTGSCQQGTGTSIKPQKATTFNRSIGFENPSKLTEHFRKHGAEFGVKSEREYLALAQQERDAPLGGDVLCDKRSDGVVTRFDRRSGGFLAFNGDKTIRTFFKPNDGETYYWRQLKR